MPAIYVAMSPSQQAWAADVGLTQHVYKVGISDVGATEAIDALNQERHAGRTDWTLLCEQAGDYVDEIATLDRVGRRETLVDPTYYPQLKNASGIFKVKVANVEKQILVRDALAGKIRKLKKLKPKDVAAYLLNIAAG